MSRTLPRDVGGLRINRTFVAGCFDDGIHNGRPYEQRLRKLCRNDVIMIRQVLITDIRCGDRTLRCLA